MVSLAGEAVLGSSVVELSVDRGSLGSSLDDCVGVGLVLFLTGDEVGVGT